MTLNERTKKILFAECKWREKVNARQTLQELKEKAKLVQWNNDKRSEYYMIFAKSFRDRIKENGVVLFDLKDLGKRLMS